MIAKRPKTPGLVEFGQIVKRKRAETGESMRSAAELIGITHSTLSRIERGKEMTVRSFALVCMYYGLKPEVFLRLVIK